MAAATATATATTPTTCRSSCPTRGTEWHPRECGRRTMIANDRELPATLERIASFQQQGAHLRRPEAHPVNCRAAASGFLPEIDRMQLEVRDHFSFLPTERGRA